MADWFTTKVASNRSETPDLFLLDLDVAGTPLVGAHQKPGQYVQLQLPPHKESFFALASAPNPTSTVFEFLLKAGSPLTDALRQLAPGAEIRTSAVQGKGFPVDRAVGHDVLLFATGAGISPVRSLIQTLALDRTAYGRIRLFFGVRSPDAFAFRQEIAFWKATAIEVTHIVSRPGNSGWEGLTGYVQAHVPREKLERTVAFLCGQKEMVKGVTEALERQGLPRENVFLNF